MVYLYPRYRILMIDIRYPEDIPLKKFLSLTLLVLVLLQYIPASAAESDSSLTLSAECAALYDAENRRPLYEKNATACHAMASTTKIMTALIALEALPLDTKVVVPAEATGIEGSSVYLKKGEVYTLEALLYALLLQSANDAAEVIAYAVAGSVPAFAQLMNEKVAALGLTNTHFDNPHGLDSEQHYTTASDLAIIACAALENPDFYKIVSSRRYTFCGVNGENPRMLINHNKLLYLYDGTVGVKTGFTKKCGRCLVSAAERDGLLLVAVTLDAPSDWSDHAKLLDYGFSRLERRVIAKTGTLSLSLPLLNTDGEVTVTNSEDITLIMERDSPTPHPVLDILPHPTLPIKKGALAGSITYTSEDGITVTSPLIYTEDIPLKKSQKGWFGIGRKAQ